MHEQDGTVTRLGYGSSDPAGSGGRHHFGTPFEQRPNQRGIQL
jgi:hypothetical protein